MIPQDVLMRSRPGVGVNAAKQKAAYNVVKGNRFNVVKASTCWVWMPKNRVVDHVSQNISASVTLKRFDYIDVQGRFKSVMAWMDAQIQGRQECSKGSKGLKTAGYRVTTACSRLMLLLKLILISQIEDRS
ncbi:hypothetical protein Tco_0825496 [Tanacetum coccineum]